MRHIIIALITLTIATTSFAQNGRLVGDTTVREPDSGYVVTLPSVSLTYQPEPRAKTYAVNDYIKVLVLEEQDYSNRLNNQRKKSIQASSSITGMFKLNGLFHLPGKMDDSDLPEIGGEINMKYQNNGSMIRNERFKTTVKCRIKTIHPNGSMELEGTKRRQIGEEMSILYVSGTIARSDIGPNDTVSSTDMAESDIYEVPEGQVYDTGRRPWGVRLLEHWSPF
jgi:flagellar L-ring protein precursor FlgH